MDDKEFKRRQRIESCASSVPSWVLILVMVLIIAYLIWRYFQ